MPGLYASRQQKNTQHGFPNRTANAEHDSIPNETDDANLTEELPASQHCLVASQLEGVRHKVLNYVIENLNSKSANGKFDHILSDLKFAAKLNLAIGFFLKNTEDRIFRDFYAHENITLLDGSKCLGTKDDLAEL